MIIDIHPNPDLRQSAVGWLILLWCIFLPHPTIYSVKSAQAKGESEDHACGDEVLIATAKALSQNVRSQDLLVRWGGEEFLILLPETNLQEAATLAERLRKAIADLQLRYADTTLNITASFGVARRSSQHQSLDSLITAADNYLYQSKEAGRNRISYNGMNATGDMPERERANHKHIQNRLLLYQAQRFLSLLFTGLH